MKISVGPPFFNQINVPIGLALLVLMGACPLLAWRKASPRNLLRASIVPGAVAAAGAVLLLAAGFRHPAAVAAFSLCLFVAVAIVQDVHRGAKVRRGHGERYAVALGRLAGRNPRRYGGYVVHLGVVLLFAGMAGSALGTERDVVLAKGETVRVGRYTLRYDGGGSYAQGERLITEAALTVFEDGRRLTEMRPQRNVHARREEQVMTEVAIRTTLREDLYVILAGMGDDGRANVRVIINPLMMWMWIGAGVLTLGTVLAAWPQAVPAAQARTRLLAEAA
jgi:cytochrome c-type biogenesis protein CcmF